jgi:hypothetical protein
VDTISDFLFEAYFKGLSVNLPSMNRWFTFGPQIALQAGSFFTHGLLRRVISKAFDKEQANAHGEDGGDDNDYHQHAHRKMVSATEFVNSPHTPSMLGLALVATIPADMLSNRLQHLDFGLGSGAIEELVEVGPASLLWKCQFKYWEMLNHWCESLGSQQARAIIWQLQGMDPETNVHDELLHVTVGMSAAIWCRFETRFPGQPEAA